MTTATQGNQNHPEDATRMRRLVWTSLVAWSAITMALTLYVLRAYPSDQSGWAVLGRQVANWMPFSLALPAMHAVVRAQYISLSSQLRTLVLVAMGCCVVLAYSGIRFVLLWMLATPNGEAAESWSHGLARMWPIAAVVYAVLLAVLFGTRARVAHAQAERAAKQLEAELATAQLRALQAQIRPHFLFNTLQAIEDACWQDPKTASRMIVQLSELLRASLEDEFSPLKTLADDVALANSYIAIQKARFEDRLIFEADIDASVTTVPFPTLWLQPLLENAISHGIESLPEGGAVRLSVRRVDEHLTVTITNDGPLAEAPIGRTIESNDGIGFTNAAARLRSVFGPSATLRFVPRPEGGAIVEARAPLNGSQ